MRHTKKTLDNMWDDSFLTLSDAIETLKTNTADLTLRDNTRERLEASLNFCQDAIQTAFDLLNDDKSYRSILHRVADALQRDDIDAECDNDQHFPVVRFTRATSNTIGRRVFAFLTSDAHDTWTIDMCDEAHDDTIDHIDTYIVTTCNDEDVIADALIKASDALLKRAAARRADNNDASVSAQHDRAARVLAALQTRAYFDLQIVATDRSVAIEVQSRSYPEWIFCVREIETQPDRVWIVEKCNAARDVIDHATLHPVADNEDERTALAIYFAIARLLD